VRKIIAAGALAFCGLMTTGVGISNADEITVPGDYQTDAACNADGPSVETSHQPPPGQVWKFFNCVHENGSIYLHLISGNP
jgi:hypothetical protein